MKKLNIILIMLFIMILIPVISQATEITKESTILLEGKAINKKVLDDKENTYISISKGAKIEIKSEENIKGLYIIYELSSKEGTITANSKIEPIGENGFLHEYINVSEKVGETQELKITYNEDVKIADIYVLGEGEIPDFVEIWDKPCKQADLLLFSTHSDDEQLFFLGLMPTYVARGAHVQVVYFAHHNDTPSRLHEQIHGLYAVGIRNYPILGIIPDAYSESLNVALSNMKKAKITEDDAIKFQVEMMRRFKAQVVVGHDEKGEYGHGQHILNTYLLEKAIKLTNDENYITDSSAWKVKKLYLHLYGENQITMDYDVPLEYFGGKTAYEVSKDGYSKHKSQQWTWFTTWINGKNNSYKKATDISTYTPLKYGLYYTTVGEDTEKNDMFENVTYYEEQMRQEELKKEKEEAEKQKQEENEKNELLENNKNSSDKKFIVLGIICIILIIAIVIKMIWDKKR